MKWFGWSTDGGKVEHWFGSEVKESVCGMAKKPLTPLGGEVRCKRCDTVMDEIGECYAEDIFDDGQEKARGDVPCVQPSHVSDHQDGMGAGA